MVKKWNQLPRKHVDRIAAALRSKVARGDPDSCWPWTGGTTIDGYGIISLYPDPPRPFAHRMAFLQAGGILKRGMAVMHQCDNPRCCNPSHLSAGTLQQNNADMFDKGRHCFGSAHPGAKLTEKDIPIIRADTRANELIAQDYGVSRAAIRAIKRRITWRHLP